MSFEDLLEDILRRYVPTTGVKENDDMVINILKIRITDLHKEVNE